MPINNRLQQQLIQIKIISRQIMPIIQCIISIKNTNSQKDYLTSHFSGNASRIFLNHIQTNILKTYLQYYMRLFLHFIENNKQDAPIDTYVADMDPSLTLQEVIKLSIINCRKQFEPSALKLFKEFGAQPIDSTLTVESTFKENDDVFIIYQGLKPVKVEKNVNEIFQTITKYSFSDGDKKVFVYLELPGIGALPAQQIQSRFLQRSFQVKIRGYNGKNYVFAVPKTQCTFNAEKSSLVQKADKLVIHIVKYSSNDHWYSLYKTKAIGETDDS